LGRPSSQVLEQGNLAQRLDDSSRIFLDSAIQKPYGYLKKPKTLRFVNVKKINETPAAIILDNCCPVSPVIGDKTWIPPTCTHFQIKHAAWWVKASQGCCKEDAPDSFNDIPNLAFPKGFLRDSAHFLD
jgi:hypothetical protein